MKTTILGGVLFLVPLVCLAFILTKAFEFSKKIATPLGRVFPLDRIAGVALADVIAIVLILALCYLAGLVARGKLFSKHVDRIDGVLIDLVPGYAVAKGILSGFVQDGEAMPVLRAVLARFDDYEQLAFEVERINDKVVVFLPGAPSAWSGTSIIISSDRITPLSLPPHQVNSLLRVLGRGTVKLQAAGIRGS